MQGQLPNCKSGGAPHGQKEIGSGFDHDDDARPNGHSFCWGFGVACAAIEAFSHTLAAEIGPQGVRVVCLRSTGSPEAAGVHQSFAKHARAAGITLKQWQANYERQTHLRRLTTLTEVANMAVFVASDWASAVTGTAMNLTCGAIVD